MGFVSKVLNLHKHIIDKLIRLPCVPCSGVHKSEDTPLLRNAVRVYWW